MVSVATAKAPPKPLPQPLYKDKAFDKKIHRALKDHAIDIKDIDIIHVPLIQLSEKKFYPTPTLFSFFIVFIVYKCLIILKMKRQIFIISVIVSILLASCKKCDTCQAWKAGVKYELSNCAYGFPPNTQTLKKWEKYLVEVAKYDSVKCKID